MKKILLVGLLTILTSAYAVDNSLNTSVKVVDQTVKNPEIKIDETTDKANNETYLYEFELAKVGQQDKATYKYLTNNTTTVATLFSLRDTLQKNWHLGNEYTNNLVLKTERKESEKLVCKYTNGLVIKVKAYGDYEKNCPLKAESK